LIDWRIFPKSRSFSHADFQISETLFSCSGVFVFMFKVFNLQPSFWGSSFSFIAWGKKNLIFFTQHKQDEVVNNVIKIANFIVSSQHGNWMHGFTSVGQSNDTTKTYFHDSTQIVWILFWEIYPLPPSCCHLQSKLTSD